MSTEHLISYEDAVKAKFDNSTLEELRHYHNIKLGEPAPARMNGPTIKSKLLRAEGLSNEFSPARVGSAKVREPIFPPYNVSPNGVWQGRRHRASISKPHGATKNESGDYISINGSKGFPIKYGEMQSIPEPVLLRLRACTRPVPHSVRTQLEDGTVEVTTELREEPRFAIDYRGIDPATRDRVGSLTEWFQLKGPDWLRERTERDCQLIATKLEMRWQDDNKVPFPHNQILDRLIEFFFGDAGATNETFEMPSLPDVLAA